MENARGFDLNVTVAWVRRVLTDPHGAASAYRETQPDWRGTLTTITLPVYVGAAVAGFLVSAVFGGTFMFGARAGAPFGFLVSLVWSVAYVFVAAWIFDFFAGVFGGSRAYDGAFAAVSLAVVPAVVAGIVSPVPWLGGLVSLVAFIYSLVLLYRFIAVFMTVPEDKRIVHYFVSLIVAAVVNIVVAGTVGALFGPDLPEPVGSTGVSEEDRGAAGWFGVDRQIDYAEQAARDEYDPPADGRLTEAQVAAYARSLQRTAELRERLGERFNEMEEEGPSIGDIFSGVGDAVRLGTAEMEVVKSAGGNWKEHQWVKNQLETARVQQDGSPAVVHNYELFLEYRDRIEQYE